MRYRLLGPSGLRISELCLGAMTFGNVRGWGADEALSQAMFNRFAEAGGTFIDTAPVYQDGLSETLIGQFTQGKRDRFVISTKYALNSHPEDPNACGNGRKSLRQAVDASLKRLKTDYIDLYWLHAWDGITPVEEIMSALNDLVRAGKILHIGLSDMPAWVAARACTLAECRGWAAPAALQLRYNLLSRSPDHDLLPLAQALNLSVLAWSGLASGLLSGKYNLSGTQLSGSGRLSHPQYRDRPLPAMVQTTLLLLQAIASEQNATLSQVALAWIRGRSARFVPILGVRTLAQLEDNLGCLKICLSDDQIERLNAATETAGPFPNDFLETDAIRSLLYGDFRDRIDAPSYLKL